MAAPQALQRRHSCTELLHEIEGEGEILCSAVSTAMARIFIGHRIGPCVIPTSSQLIAGRHQSSLESQLLAEQSCAKQPLGAAAKWKEAVSAGFPQARPAAKQQTDTQVYYISVPTDRERLVPSNKCTHVDC